MNWDTHIYPVLSKFYGYPKEQLDLLFQRFILSVFTYAIEVWGSVIPTNT